MMRLTDHDLMDIEAQLDDTVPYYVRPMIAELRRCRATLQRVMQVLGPDVPTDVDYRIPENAAGLIAEVQEALRLLTEHGIRYRSGRDPGFHGVFLDQS